MSVEFESIGIAILSILTVVSAVWIWIKPRTGALVCFDRGYFVLDLWCHYGGTKPVDGDPGCRWTGYRWQFIGIDWIAIQGKLKLSH